MKKILLILLAAVMAFTACEQGLNDQNHPTPELGENLPDPDIPGVTNISVMDFLNADVSDTKWYKLKGIVRNLSNTTYGNFVLEDKTGSVYVYGLTNDNWKNGFHSRKNNRSFGETGVKEGDFLILVGTRDRFEASKDPDNADQVGGPAYYIAHESPKAPDTDPDHGGDIVPPTPGTTTCKYVWAELPGMTDADNDGHHDTDDNIYYAQHWCAGGEQCGSGNDRHTARNFTTCFSKKDHCPLWVAAPRHAMYVGGGRHDAYKPDPKIPSDIQYYSKNTGAGCNKGHLLGSHERTKTTATNHQVFYYSNIAPQNGSTYNTGGGAWNNLEGVIDGFDCSDTLYQVVGCYFKDWTSKSGITARAKKISYGGRSDVSWPTMMYIAVLRTKKGNTGKSVLECSANELKCVAFCISHNEAKGHQPNKNDMMSISDLEKLTGFSYFVNVPNAPKNTFNPSDWNIR